MCVYLFVCLSVCVYAIPDDGYVNFKYSIVYCVVLLNISLTRIFLWIDFLKDMVDFWIQVVPPEKDKNPEVALETLLTEQKGNMPRLEFVLNFNQDCDIVIIESAYLVNPISLVVKFMVSQCIFLYFM